MIHIAPGDLLQIEAYRSEDRQLPLKKFYYALVLDKVSLFGGQLCFIPYLASNEPLTMEEVLKEPVEGFYAIVDFIWAKRQNRALKTAKKLDITKFNRGVEYFKGTHPYPKGEKAQIWFIYNRLNECVKTVTILTEEEKCYPLHARIDDPWMTRLVDERWAPENDPMI